MQQPFGLFSITFEHLEIWFHDFPGLENLNFKKSDFPGFVSNLQSQYG